MRSSSSAGGGRAAPDVAPKEIVRAFGATADARLFAVERGDRVRTLSKISASNSPSSLRAEGEAIHAAGRGGGMDCFVASLLAMTVAGCLN